MAKSFTRPVNIMAEFKTEMVIHCETSHSAFRTMVIISKQFQNDLGYFFFLPNGDTELMNLPIYRPEDTS